MILALMVVAAAGVGAYKLYSKYHTVSAAVAAVSAELVLIEKEASAATVDASIKAEVSSLVKRIENLLP